MLQKYNLIGDLKFGQHKAIQCNVQLQVNVLADEEWESVDLSKFIDGVSASGEFSFECSPSFETPVRKNLVGELVVNVDDLSSKMNIVVLDRNSVAKILPNKINRYYWGFMPIGKPVWDHLSLFPKHYRGKKQTMNRVFACTNFRGYWPVGVSSIVVAVNKHEAKELLDQKLRQAGIMIEAEYEFQEIDLDQKGAHILVDGN